MDTSTTSSDDPMVAAVDNSRRGDHHHIQHHPALDTATRRYMDPFAHLDVRRMVESSGRVLGSTVRKVANILLASNLSSILDCLTILPN